MKSEYRGLVAIVLSVAVMVLWYTVFAPQKKEAATPVAQTEGRVATTPEPAKEVRKEEPAQKAASNDPQATLPVTTTTVKTGLSNIEFTNDGAVPIAWQLQKYEQQVAKENMPVDLVTPDTASPALRLGFVDANFEFPERPRYRLVEATENELRYRWQSHDVEVIKTITFTPTSYVADVLVEVINHSNRVLNERPLLSWSGLSLPQQKAGFFSFLKQPPTTNKSPVYYLNGSVKRESNVAKITKEQEQSGTLYWAGLEDRYFLTAIIPREGSSDTTVSIGSQELSQIKGGHELISGAALAKTSIPQGEKAVHKFSVYAGPKEINQLKAVGVRLEEAIDYGWFTVIAVPILYLLKFFHHVVRNYGAAIILLTVFIKLLLHPINIKSLKSMKQMQLLQPRLKELQQKFKSDKERLNMETMQLFRSHKVNPMGGCLPMLLQFPIYIALYKVLWGSIELYRAPFFWFYKDLSAPDPYLITPILLGIGMVFQQKLMPSTSADPAQQKMMMFMPIMFSVFMLFLPVGLVIYILVNTAMSVTQQMMYNKNIRLRDLMRGRWQPTGA
jgi:YidC/Oxa1 family membrane protein insertase